MITRRCKLAISRNTRQRRPAWNSFSRDRAIAWVSTDSERTSRFKKRRKFLTLPQQKTVAIIEDDPFMRTSVVRLLSVFGYATEAFDSAEAFLNTAPTSEAVCLVADIQLGGLSGIDLAHQLKADGFTFPIIFMTALDDERIRSQAAATGCVALLRKPFSAQLLSHALVKATR